MTMTGRKLGFLLDTIILVFPWLSLYSFREPLTVNNGNTLVIAYCIAVLAFSLHILVILFAIFSSKIQSYLEVRMALEKMQVLAMAKILNMESIVLTSPEFKDFLHPKENKEQVKPNVKS